MADQIPLRPQYVPPPKVEKPRKSMRPYTKDRAKLNRTADKWRREYLVTHPRCAVYPKLDSSQCHEISSGSFARVKSLMVPAAILAVSDAGHRWIQDQPEELQLALKLITDPDEFDLWTVNVLRGRAPHTAITLADLAPFLQLKP